MTIKSKKNLGKQFKNGAQFNPTNGREDKHQQSNIKSM